MSLDAILSAPAVASELPLKPIGGSQAAEAETSKPAKSADAEAAKPADDGEAVRAAGELSEMLSGYNVSLKFSRDDQTGRTVIELVDPQSGETLRQMPSEVSLHLTAVFGKMQGQLFNRQA